MYDEFYGFTAKPFQLTPDPRFYYESATHRAAMAYLGYGLAQGEGFIVITGEVGAGKTTLVAHLMATLDRARLNVLHLVSTQLEGDDILRMVAQSLGLATEALAKAQLLDRIERTLRAVEGEGKRTLLIVDEAQNLPVSALEELRMLSNFTSGGRSLVQIFLLGQPEFRDRLASSERLEQLRQRVIASHHLTPMGEDEIEPYVAHRLALVGWADRPHFTRDAYAALYAASAGVPRRLNRLAGRVLLQGAVDELDLIDGAVVDVVAADEVMERGTAAEPQATVAPEGRPLRRTSDAEPETAGASVRALRASGDAEIARRLAQFEERLEEQEGALRRVLTLLIDWIERDEPAAGRSNAA